MTAPVIGFIGAGNMATSLIGGMLQKNVKPANLIASDTKAEQCAALERQFHIRTATDNAIPAAECDILLLAVKPQVMQAVCQDLTPHLAHGPLIVSIAAGPQAICNNAPIPT